MGLAVAASIWGALQAWLWQLPLFSVSLKASAFQVQKTIPPFVAKDAGNTEHGREEKWALQSYHPENNHC